MSEEIEQAIEYVLMNNEIIKDDKKEELLKYYFNLQQENQKKLYTSNGNEFTKYELLDDYERILQENQQLKEKIEWYEKENKHNQEIIIKDTKVLDEIREYIKTHVSYEKNSDGYGEPYLGGYEIQDILQILDKVKE